MNAVSFHEQNFILKIFAVILGIIVTTCLKYNLFVLLFVFTLVYAAFNFRILSDWVRVNVKLLPFFSSLIILTIIFRLDIFEQLMMISKISYLLLLSVYLIKTSDLNDLLHFLGKNNNLDKIISFLIITINFIPLFYDNFTVIFQKSKNLIDTFTRAVGETYKQRLAVAEMSKKQLQESALKKEFWCLENMLLELLIAVELLLFSVKF